MVHAAPSSGAQGPPKNARKVNEREREWKREIDPPIPPFSEKSGRTL